MTRAKLAAVVLAVHLLPQSTATAQHISAAQFVAFCRASEGSGQLAYCMGFLNGFMVYDGMLSELQKQKLLAGRRFSASPQDRTVNNYVSSLLSMPISTRSAFTCHLPA